MQSLEFESFLDLLEDRNEAIIPTRGGTGNCYLTGIEYKKEEDKNPRVVLTVTQKLANGSKRVSYPSIWDPQFDGYSRTEQQKTDDIRISTENLIHLLNVYGATSEAIREKLVEAKDNGADVKNDWSAFAKAAIDALPEGFDEKVSTWKLIYRKDILSLPKYKPFVMLGAGGFKWDDRYDKIVPESPQRTDSNAQPDPMAQVNATPLKDLF